MRLGQIDPEPIQLAPGVAHAIQNTGPQPMILMSFDTSRTIAPIPTPGRHC